MTPDEIKNFSERNGIRFVDVKSSTCSASGNT